MKSNKQRRVELNAKRAAKRAETSLASTQKEKARKDTEIRKNVPVNRSALVPDNSYGVPDFVDRGYYIDRPFHCKSCGIEQMWAATQQKWWYEVAKGNVWTTAVLCRPCRRREQARRADARRVHQEGLARKRGNGG